MFSRALSFVLILSEVVVNEWIRLTGLLDSGRLVAISVKFITFGLCYNSNSNHQISISPL